MTLTWTPLISAPYPGQAKSRSCRHPPPCGSPGLQHQSDVEPVERVPISLLPSCRVTTVDRVERTRLA